MRDAVLGPFSIGHPFWSRQNLGLYGTRTVGVMGDHLRPNDGASEKGMCGIHNIILIDELGLTNRGAHKRTDGRSYRARRA